MHRDSAHSVLLCCLKLSHHAYIEVKFGTGRVLLSAELSNMNITVMRNITYFNCDAS